MQVLNETIIFLGNNSECKSPLLGWSCTVWGYIMAVLSILMFGSFTINFKLGSLAKTGFDPMVMQIYMNIAIGLSSLITLSYIKWQYYPWGILSGGLWLLTNMMAIVAIQNIGISIAQGIWSGCTIVVSFVWGAAIFHQKVESIGLSILALIVLGIGITGISISGTNLLADKSEHESEQLIETADGTIQEDNAPSRKQLIVGFACAILLGIPNGSVYAPIHYLQIDSAVQYLVSFGLGLLIATPVFALPYFFFILKEKPDWNLKVLPLRAGLAGIMWNIGNWASLYALQYLGYTVGFPLCQCALLLGGFWGIVLFKEIQGWKRIGLYIVSCLVLVGGAVLLGLYGQAS